MENSQENTQEVNNDLVLEAQAQIYLKETRKWAKFLAIMGFIFMGLMVLISIVTFVFSSSMSNQLPLPFPIPFAIFGFVYLAFAAIYFFPIYYLLQFANKAKHALLEQNTQTLTESMQYLKSHYKFLGIFTIVMLALYPIGIVVALIVGLSQGL